MPWLQVDQDGLGRCRLLARLLGVPETQGIGIGMALWQWALEIAPEGDFSGAVPDSALVPAAVSWPVADGERLLTELQRVGLVASSPQLRVRGLDRYRRAWEKNRRNPSKRAESGTTVPETGANPRGTREEPARQTHTQNEKKNEKKNTSTAPGPPSPRESDRLMADFLEIIQSPYVFGGAKDGAALAHLQKTETMDEISRRWRIGLNSSGWLGVRTLAQLRSKWNDLAQGQMGDLRKPVAPGVFEESRTLENF